MDYQDIQDFEAMQEQEAGKLLNFECFQVEIKQFSIYEFLQIRNKMIKSQSI